MKEPFSPSSSEEVIDVSLLSYVLCMLHVCDCFRQDPFLPFVGPSGLCCSTAPAQHHQKLSVGGTGRWSWKYEDIVYWAAEDAEKCCQRKLGSITRSRSLSILLKSEELQGDNKSQERPRIKGSGKKTKQ